MADSDTIRMGRWWRSFFLDLLPIFSVFLLVLFIALPMGYFSLAHVGGLWPMMGITYWTLVRPRAMGPFVVFLFGIATDLITFLPLGLHAFVFVLAQIVLKRQRRFLVGQGFLVLWASFAILAFSVALLLALIAQAIQGVSVPFTTTCLSAVLASSFLPLLLWVLDRVHALMDLFDEPV